MPKRTPARDTMLAAHIQYELEQYAPERLAVMLRQEVAALYAFLDGVQVSELVQPEQLLAFLRRTLVEHPLPSELLDFVRENLLITLELVQDEQTALGEIVPQAVYEHLVDTLAGMEEARLALTHQLVRSSIYSRLIANVLYHGTKSFLLSENGVARTIPGAAAFVRLGQNALNAAAPQLEKNADRQLLTFIQDNIQQLIADSETFLNRTVDEALIGKVGAEVWESAAEQPLSKLTAALDRKAMGDWGETAQEFWLHFRTTPLMDDILQSAVRGFFLHYGRQRVGEVLTRLGFSADLVGQELTAWAEPLAQHALASGYLESRIRARLEPFYTAYFAEQTAAGGAG